MAPSLLDLKSRVGAIVRDGKHHGICVDSKTSEDDQRDLDQFFLLPIQSSSPLHSVIQELDMPQQNQELLLSLLERFPHYASSSIA